MSDAKNFPAVGLLAVFGLGSAAAAGGLAGSGWLMVQQGLTQDAAAPLATAAVCLGSFLSGLLMALAERKRACLGRGGRCAFCGAAISSGHTVPE